MKTMCRARTTLGSLFAAALLAACGGGDAAEVK